MKPYQLPLPEPKKPHFCERQIGEPIISCFGNLYAIDENGDRVYFKAGEVMGVFLGAHMDDAGVWHGHIKRDGRRLKLGVASWGDPDNKFFRREAIRCRLSEEIIAINDAINKAEGGGDHDSAVNKLIDKRVRLSKLFNEVLHKLDDASWDPGRPEDILGTREGANRT